MSIITNFKDPSGNDLGSIFLPGSGLGYDTGYRDINGIDFSQLFMPLGSYIPYPYPTNYKISNGKDLNTIFASVNQASLPFLLLSTLYSYIYDYSNSMYYITSDTSGSIKFISDISGYIHVVLVGGGGAGGGASGSSNAGTGGAGGGAIDVYTTMGTGISKNTQYNFTIGAGGTGVQNNNGTSGSNSTFGTTTQNYVTSNGGTGGYIKSSTSFGPSGATSTINYPLFLNSFSVGGSSGGFGGQTTPTKNYTGGFGGSSDLSTYYYTNASGSASSNNTIQYSGISNTFLIYNLMLLSGGGGGGTDGGGSDGFSAWGGWGVPDFGGNIYGYTTNTVYPISATSGQTVGYGQNNNPPTTQSGFPNTSQSLPGVAPGGGGAGVGTILQTGGNGANGVIKFYFNYTSITTNNYFTLSGNAKYYLMNNGTSNYFIINCWAGNSTINFTSQVSNCTAIVVGGGGGGGSGAYFILSNVSYYFSGAGGGGGGAGVYNNLTLNGTYNINVGTGGVGGIYTDPYTNPNGPNGKIGNPTTIKNSSNTTTYAQATGGTGGKYSSSQSATGGTQGTCSGTWTLSTSSSGAGGNGGQGSENEPDPNPLTSGNQAMYGLSSALINYNLPDGTMCYFSGGGGAGSCKYSGATVSANYYGGGAGHGYGGFVGASWNLGSASINGQNATIFGAGGGGGSSNTFNGSTTPQGYPTGGNGANGLVLFIIPI